MAVLQPARMKKKQVRRTLHNACILRIGGHESTSTVSYRWTSKTDRWVQTTWRWKYVQWIILATHSRFSKSSRKWCINNDHAIFTMRDETIKTDWQSLSININNSMNRTTLRQSNRCCSRSCSLSRSCGHVTTDAGRRRRVTWATMWATGVTIIRMNHVNIMRNDRDKK